MANNTTKSATNINCYTFQSLEGKVFKTIADLSVLLFSVFGNSVVIWTVHTNKALKTPIHTFFQNMAVSDLLVPLIVMPFELIELWTGEPRIWLVPGGIGDVLCKCFVFGIDTVIMASICTLMLITINRFLAVAMPVNRIFSSKLSTIISLLTVWLVSAALYAPYFHYFGAKVSSDGDRTCQILPHVLPHVLDQYGLAQLVFRSAIPFITLVVLYIIITVKLIRHRLPKHQLSDLGRKQRSRERNVTGLALATVVAFLLCWLPYNTLSVMMYKKLGVRHTCTIVRVNEIAQLLIFAQSAINPFILFFFSTHYRHGLKQILPRCKICKWNKTFHPYPQLLECYELRFPT